MFLHVLIGSYGFLWVAMGLIVIMGSYKSLCVLMCPDGSVWVFMGFYRFLGVLMLLVGPCGSLLGSYGL